jgi:hypothetical protein
MEQAIRGQMGQPAACMMENKTGLQAVAAATGGLISIDGIMAYEHGPPYLAFPYEVAF